MSEPVHDVDRPCFGRSRTATLARLALVVALTFAASCRDEAPSSARDDARSSSTPLLTRPRPRPVDRAAEEAARAQARALTRARLRAFALRRAALTGLVRGHVAGLPPLPPPWLDPTQPLDALMRDEVALRLGRPHLRDELIAVLRWLPARAPESMRASWRQIVDALPAAGPLAPLCKQCHVQWRLPYRQAAGAWPPPAAPERPDRP